MTTELKPCPFCICCAVYRNQDQFGGCGASTGWHETEAEAISAWNRRTQA